MFIETSLYKSFATARFKPCNKDEFVLYNFIVALILINHMHPFPQFAHYMFHEGGAYSENKKLGPEYAKIHGYRVPETRSNNKKE